MIEVLHDHGVHLPAHHLWLDPSLPRDLAFVSHAHADHMAGHRQLIASPVTARLIRARFPDQAKSVAQFIELDFHQPWRLPGSDAHITLLPAGHILGSAQLHLQSPAGSLLYTGDFKLRPGLSAEPAEFLHAHTLVMETTFGRPEYRFPPTSDTLARVIAFCHDAIEENATPVLLAYSLGKSQEILAALHHASLPIMLHPSVQRMTEIYQHLGHDFPPHLPWQPAAAHRHVLLCPPSLARSSALARIPARRLAILTGWAMDRNALHRHQCDAAFPLSDHADYDDLLRAVHLVQPQRILTLHGFAADFARDLRRLGHDAWSLTQNDQMELDIPAPPVPPLPVFQESPSVVQDSLPASSYYAPDPAPAASHWTPDTDDHPQPAPDAPKKSSAHQPAPTPALPPAAFAALAALGHTLARTPSRTRKTALLADYLRTLPDTALPLAATYLAGRPFPPASPLVLHTGPALLRRALLTASGLDEPRLRALSRQLADSGATAAAALAARPLQPAEKLHFPAVERLFSRLAATRAPAPKQEILENALRSASPREAEFLIRILTGDLRLGLKESILEDAIAAASAPPASPDDVREAHMITGDLGTVALLARQGRLHQAEIQLFRPLKVMLASPEPDAHAIRARHPHAETLHIEDKYDGIRAQLHWDGARRAELYTRDLKNITAQFPEIIQSARVLDAPLILDGEILAWSDGRPLPFQNLQRRLGRTDPGPSPDLFHTEPPAPLAFIPFDLLWLDHQSLHRLPLHHRLRLLATLPLPHNFHPPHITPARTPEEIDHAFHSARQRGNEGLIIKDPASLYTPGRRGHAWIKLKKALPTLDCVVIAAEEGHGKRAGLLSDYTFAVRDHHTGNLLAIGKAYTGLTDPEIEELTELFTRTTLRQKGRLRHVRPQIVLEIAFDNIQPSKRHPSGLALRFPRIKTIRRDKSPEDADTLAHALTLVQKP